MENLYNEFMNDTINTIKKLSADQVNKFVDLLLGAYKHDRSIFIAGNGGSAATASHFHEDICFGALSGVTNPRRFKLSCLSDSTPYITAVGNDTTFEDIFVNQLKNLSDKNSIFIGIYCSGNSRNIVKCVEYSLSNQMEVFCLLGYDGGALGKLTKNNILVKEDDFSSKYRTHNFGIIEGVHSLILHYVVYEINKRLKENKI